MLSCAKNCTRWEVLRCHAIWSRKGCAVRRWWRSTGTVCAVEASNTLRWLDEGSEHHYQHQQHWRHNPRVLWKLTSHRHHTTTRLHIMLPVFWNNILTEKETTRKSREATQDWSMKTVRKSPTDEVTWPKRWHFNAVVKLVDQQCFKLKKERQNAKYSTTISYSCIKCCTF